MSTFIKGDRALVPVNRMYHAVPNGSLVEDLRGLDADGDYRVRIVKAGNGDTRKEGEECWAHGPDMAPVTPTSTTAPLFELIPPVPAKPSVRITLTAAQVEYLYDLVGECPLTGEVPDGVYGLLIKVQGAIS